MFRRPRFNRVRTINRALTLSHRSSNPFRQTGEQYFLTTSIADATPRDTRVSLPSGWYTRDFQAISLRILYAIRRCAFLVTILGQPSFNAIVSTLWDAPAKERLRKTVSNVLTLPKQAISPMRSQSP